MRATKMMINTRKNNAPIRSAKLSLSGKKPIKNEKATICPTPNSSKKTLNKPLREVSS